MKERDIDGNNRRTRLANQNMKFIHQNRIRVYSLACDWDASQKIEMLLKIFRIKTLKKTYLCIDCSENMWLATEELSPEYHGKKRFIFHC